MAATPPHIGWGKYFLPVKSLLVRYANEERGATSVNHAFAGAGAGTRPRTCNCKARAGIAELRRVRSCRRESFFMRLQRADAGHDAQSWPADRVSICSP